MSESRRHRRNSFDSIVDQGRKKAVLAVNKNRPARYPCKLRRCFNGVDSVDRRIEQL